MCERGFGRIVIITSESWRNGMSMGLSNYAAAKSAALGFMRHLAHEVGRQGVTANALSLGAMNNLTLCVGTHQTPCAANLKNKKAR